MGKYIHEHLLQHQKRAEYGKQLFIKLSIDLTISSSVLYKILEFYREFPNWSAPADLYWTHYTLLLTVKNKEKRQELQEKVKKEKLSTRELALLIQQYIQQTQPQIGPPKPHIITEHRGIPFIYQLKNITIGPQKKKNLILDLGFRIRATNRISNLSRFTEGDIVEVSGITDSVVKVKKTGYTKKQIFTYKAFLGSISDGDTIWAEIDLGFNKLFAQKLRFYSIDTPDIDTPEGKKAMRFVSRALNSVDFFIVKAHFPDAHERYLAEIYYLPDEKDIYTVAAKGRFLNQELVDAGLAKVVKTT